MNETHVFMFLIFVLYTCAYDICINTVINMCAHVCVCHTFVSIHTRICVHVLMQICDTHMYMSAYKHTYMYTYVYVHIHTHVYVLSSCLL